MTKGLSATLAIAVALNESTVMEDGGPVDNLARITGIETLATGGGGIDRETEADVTVAKAQAPSIAGQEQNAWSLFGEAEEKIQRAPPPPTRRPQTRPLTITGKGELDRDRMNLENRFKSVESAVACSSNAIAGRKNLKRTIIGKLRLI